MSNYYLSDLKGARCDGLYHGLAKVGSLAGSYIEADVAKKEDGPFYCGECHSEAFLRVCREKVTHFVHKADRTSLMSIRNQELHDQIKKDLCNKLNAASGELLWQTEVVIPYEASKGKKDIMRPDIAGRIKPDPKNPLNTKGLPVAIEIQRSTYSISYLHERLLTYHNLGIYVLYIIPITKKLGQGAKFRPRLFEKFLHQSYLGRVYYYDISDPVGLLYPMHFSPAVGSVPSSEYYSKNGEHIFHSGYDFIYSTLKTANWGPSFSIFNAARFEELPEYLDGDERKKVPGRRVVIHNAAHWWDKDERKKLLQKKIRKLEHSDDYDFVMDDDF